DRALPRSAVGVGMSDFDPQNYYTATTPPPPPHAPLTGALSVDVCIVGGGISGLSAALHLVERGFTVALLEAKHLGFGGSGRSGGQTIFGYASGQEKLKKIVGDSAARQMWDVALEGQTLHEEYGYRSVRRVGHDELRTLVASDRYTTGLYDSASGHLNPYKYTLGL